MKLIKVARDNFSSLLDIRDHNGDLMIIGEFSQTLPNSMSNFKVAIGIVLATKLSNHSIEVKDEEVLISESSSPLEKNASKDI